MSKKSSKKTLFQWVKQITVLIFILIIGYFLQSKCNLKPAMREIVNQFQVVMNGGEINYERIFSRINWQQFERKKSHNVYFKNGSDVGGNCELNLYQNQAPVIEIAKMAKESKIICNYAFAGRASFISKSTLYSAEHLTKQKILKAKKLERINLFHPDERLAEHNRAELEDYRGQDYDRGHLAPNANMSDVISQYQSFSLANIIPEVAEHNRKTWVAIEKATRQLALKYENIYTVTLPVYQNFNGTLPTQIKTIGKNQVYVPNFIAKAIFVPALKQAVVVFTPNDASHRIELMSLAKFQKIAHIDVFPTIDIKIKQKKGHFFSWQSEW